MLAPLRWQTVARAAQDASATNEAEETATTLINEYEQGGPATRTYPTSLLAAEVAAAAGGRGYGVEHVDRYLAIVSGPND